MRSCRRRGQPDPPAKRFSVVIGIVLGYIGAAISGIAAPFVLSPGGQLEELHTPAGYAFSGAAALSSANVPVGLSFNGQPRATIWNDGKTTLLEPLAAYQASWATDINAVGQVVGISDCPANSIGCGDRYHATLWSGGQVIDIGVPGGFDRSYPVAINDLGEVLLRADTHKGADISNAFLWSGGSFRNLGAFDPVALNNLGQVIGRPFGPYPEQTFIPADLNDRGEQVGWYMDRGFFPARYDGTVLTVLSQYKWGAMNRVNSAGDAAGYYDGQIIIWRHDGDIETVMLPSHFSFVAPVQGFNDQGLILINGGYTPVPEPSGLWLLSGPMLLIISRIGYRSRKWNRR